jgi:hypothetical protein
LLADEASEVSALQLGTAVLLGAAGLALWIDVRLGERCPRTVKKVLLHAVGAGVMVRLVAALASQLLDPAAVPRTVMALCLIVLPAWVYAFLVSIWALKLVRSALPR